MKAEEFKGLLFVKVNIRVNRDTAVAMLRSARIHEGDTTVWATQDLQVPISVRFF